MPTGATALKAYFETGDTPSSTEFGELIDGNLNLNDGGTVVGATNHTGILSANNATNSIGNTRFMNFGASLAATNGGSVTYGEDDILVEIGTLNTDNAQTYANSTAPTKILVEKVNVLVQVASHDTHLGNIFASATSGTATNTAVSSVTEVVGAGAVAISPTISADASVTEVDINLNATAGTVHVFHPNITLPITTNHLYLCTHTAINENDFNVGRYSIQVQYTLL